MDFLCGIRGVSYHVGYIYLYPTDSLISVPIFDFREWESVSSRQLRGPDECSIEKERFWFAGFYFLPLESVCGSGNPQD
jgi:hypothetical protein